MAKKPQISTKKPIYDVNWYDDKYQSNVVLRNWMIVITFLAVLGILLMTVASYYFVPLKSVSPFVIQIDEGSGVTQVIDSKDSSEYTENELLIKYFANKYIKAREEYNYLRLSENNKVVEWMSMPDVRSEYYRFMNSPDGYTMAFATHTDRKAELITSQVKLNKTNDSFNVTSRYHITETTTQRRPNEFNLSVTLIGHFANDSDLPEDKRLINPLGFYVEYYNIDKERNDDTKP